MFDARTSTVRDVIARGFAEVFAESGQGDPPRLDDDLVLLDSGLDSLGFAVLVTQLEDELGYDPFLESPEPYYPRTFGEFVDFYERHAP